MIKARKTKSGMRYDVRIRRPDGTVYNKTFKSKREADRWERSELSSRDRGTWIDPASASRNFGDVATEWLESNPGKRASAFARDEVALRLHIMPVMGGWPIGSITPGDVQKLVNKWSTTMAPRSTRRTYDVLRAIFTMATMHDIIGRSPCRGIKLPEAKPIERSLPTPEQVAELAKAIGPDYEAMVWIGAMLGLRWGEVAGLRVGRLDLLRRTLTVAEQVTRGMKGVRVVGEPKSAAGRRTLTIPEPLIGVLAEHLQRKGLSGAHGDAFLFTSPEGDELRYSNWRRRQWRRACEAVGLDGLGFHDLRRLNATLLVEQGVNVRTAQSRLGHSDPRLTLEVYAQATDEADESAADAIGIVFSQRQDDDSEVG